MPWTKKSPKKQITPATSPPSNSRDTFISYPLVLRSSHLALHDRDGGAGADAIGAGGDHLLPVFAGADAARRLHAHLLADDAAHELDVLHRRAAGTEAGRRLHERRARRLREHAAL